MILTYADGHFTFNKNMRQFGVRIKFKSLFMSDEEKHGHHFDVWLKGTYSLQITELYVALARNPSLKCFKNESNSIKMYKT